ncbi:DUF1592 domain-containing protein [Humisphaera borealis]|uniref:DUF1592 domain-containing protein n=2 Tax=Humisphaera borealis TaxID=2807512 RepID=A0A7M2X3T8_9BACT|nr:DUF1592 domain-containing protein [Humisphaera borealis]
MTIVVLCGIRWFTRSDVTIAASPASAAIPPQVSGDGESHRRAALVTKYCSDCHNADLKKGGLNLDPAVAGSVTDQAEVWEKVVRRLATRQMPPSKVKERPTEAEYSELLNALSTTLDAAATERPHPGRTQSIRRLTRVEYQNAIRDLLALDVDAAALLPADEASHGFDNVTVGTLSPTLLDRYVSAAEHVSRLAVGCAQRVPGGETFRIKPDVTQEEQVEGLPFGTRGGAPIRYTFPRDGEYEVTIRLSRDRNDEVEGLHEPHDLLVLLGGVEKKAFVVKPPPRGAGHNDVDKHLQLRFPVTAGPHVLGVTFVKNPSSLLEYKRQPYEARFNFHRHPRTSPAIYQVSIVGPFGPGTAGDTPSRRRVFVAYPAAEAEEIDSARKILGALLRRAWRRPVTDADVARLISVFAAARRDSDFETGIQAALSAVLVSREFLFRVERQPESVPAGTVYPVSSLELASRLSFFLWSSLPDDELLKLAENGELSRPEVLAGQARRMLADPRAQSLVTNFAAQWLHLRNLDSFTPDGRLFPDFDDNLRQSMRRETELLLAEIVRQDGSLLSLIRSDHAWLNQRLAMHYGIPHVYGSHFRRVTLLPESHRGGLLRQASVLAVTSYATRTSPVLRGKWVLENLLGTPPPPPPPDIPALESAAVAESLPVRQRLAVHRDNAACASCHEFIDPPGFALEGFDAVGRWRVSDGGSLVDASGGLPDGRTFDGVDGLERALTERPELLVTTVAEKLLTFALGRGIEYYDAPALRQVVRDARRDDYRLSAIIVGLVRSAPFRMREAHE